MPLSLDAVNALDDGAFVEAFGDIAEHAPWVAATALKSRPFSSRHVMIEAFGGAIDAAPRDRQLALLRAHPDLAGRAARAGTLTADSTREQAGLGLDTLSEAEFERFHALNAAYKARNGFPFIFAVKGATKYMILNAFEQRLENDAEEEWETALIQVKRIVRFRLEDRVAAIPDPR